MNVNDILGDRVIRISVPCRIDFGGTLDISTFYLPLNRLQPSTFNIALDMRTSIAISSFDEGFVKVSSKGFDTAVFESHKAPFDHPMGLMFAIADYFNAQGVHLHIESSSPPRSALGGSSSAAVAIVAGFLHMMDQEIDPQKTAWLAHYIESSVAGVPCGMQDQLAAAFGGVNQWFWEMGPVSPQYRQVPVFEDEAGINTLRERIIVAYCGNPHVSKDINKRWTRQFICGENRDRFEKISQITRTFSEAVAAKKFREAARLMNQETQLRLDMTPDVLDTMGKKMFDVAMAFNGGTRFAGAGGGGCVWAIAEAEDIALIKTHWESLCNTHETAKVLNARIDQQGILVHDSLY